MILKWNQKNNFCTVQLNRAKKAKILISQMPGLNNLNDDT